MAIKTDAQAATAKWVQNLSASTSAITAGVNAVTVAPGALAAKAKTKWLNNVTAAADKWASRVGSVSLSSWQNSMNTVGVARVAQGAQAKQGKFTDFMTQFLPYLASGVSKVQSMPSTTLEDNINRAVTMIRHNAAFKRSAS